MRKFSFTEVLSTIRRFMPCSRTGLIEKFDHGTHQLQLLVFRLPKGFKWEVRQAYMPGGRLLKSCVLSSKHTRTNWGALWAGKRAFAKELPSAPTQRPRSIFSWFPCFHGQS